MKTSTEHTVMARGRMTPQHLTTIRQCLAWSQARLARELGVSPATVCRWESGKIKIPDSMARLIGLVSGALPPLSLKERRLSNGPSERH